MHPWSREALVRTFCALHRPRRGLRVILFYHSVGSALPMAQSATAFRAQIQYLARWFRVVKLSDLLGAAAATANENLAAITFDDGYVDNATTARPILETAGLPGTFFVVTGALGRDLQVSSGRFRLMTPDQVKSLAGGGHEVGAHSVTHPRLPELPLAAARAEVADSKRYLEDLLGTAVTSFSYPKGRTDERIRACVAEAGYRQAVVTRRAFVTFPVDAFALPRLTVRDYIRQSLWKPEGMIRCMCSM